MAKRNAATPFKRRSLEMNLTIYAEQTVEQIEHFRPPTSECPTNRTMSSLRNPNSTEYSRSLSAPDEVEYFSEPRNNMSNDHGERNYFLESRNNISSDNNDTNYFSESRNNTSSDINKMDYFSDPRNNTPTYTNDTHYFSDSPRNDISSDINERFRKLAEDCSARAEGLRTHSSALMRHCSARNDDLRAQMGELMRLRGSNLQPGKSHRAPQMLKRYSDGYTYEGCRMDYDQLDQGFNRNGEGTYYAENPGEISRYSNENAENMRYSNKNVENLARYANEDARELGCLNKPQSSIRHSGRSSGSHGAIGGTRDIGHSGYDKPNRYSWSGPDRYLTSKVGIKARAASYI